MSDEDPGGDDQEIFGWELCLDLFECEGSLLSDRDHIERFLVDLCDSVLEMRRYGAPFIERFGFQDETTTGYSAVQLIETSSVVCHFSEAARAVYLDIFSCRNFSAESVEAFCAERFSGRPARSTLLVRPLPTPSAREAGASAPSAREAGASIRVVGRS